MESENLRAVPSTAGHHRTARSPISFFCSPASHTRAINRSKPSVDGMTGFDAGRSAFPCRKASARRFRSVWSRRQCAGACLDTAEYPINEELGLARVEYHDDQRRSKAHRPAWFPCRWQMFPGAANWQPYCRTILQGQVKPPRLPDSSATLGDQGPPLRLHDAHRRDPDRRRAPDLP